MTEKMPQIKDNEIFFSSGSNLNPGVFGASAQEKEQNQSSSVADLKINLALKEAENKNLVSQLGCLISLIKRSWIGDKQAILYLSNIVGMDPPLNLAEQEDRDPRPNSQMYPPTHEMKRWESSWKRLTMKLLYREYFLSQQEIQENQLQYLASRQSYMEALLQEHHETMARLDLHHRTEPVINVHEMDSQYLQQNQRKKTRSHDGMRLTQSASAHRKQMTTDDDDDKMKVPMYALMRHLPFPETSPCSQAISNNGAVQSATVARRKTMSASTARHLPPNTYNNPGRYTQGDLYALAESDGIQRPRPVSAVSLRAGDIIRSRPRSGRAPCKSIHKQENEESAQLPHRTERALKYEVTRPVRCRPHSAKLNVSEARRRASEESRILIPCADVISVFSHQLQSADRAGTDSEHHPEHQSEHHPEHQSEHHPEHQDKSEKDNMVRNKDSENILDTPGTPPRIRRKKLHFQQPPACILEFEKDEQARREMEVNLQRTVINLQRKLGINDSGLVTCD